MTRDDYFLFVFSALFFFWKSVTKISRSPRIVTRSSFRIHCATALARREKYTPTTPTDLHGYILSLSFVNRHSAKGLTTLTAYYREENENDDVRVSHVQSTAALYRNPMLWSSHCTRSVITIPIFGDRKQLPLIVLTPVKWAKNEGIKSIHSRNGTMWRCV